MDKVAETPPPGSKEAVQQGCQCPVIDNAHGKGWMGGVKDENGEVMFVISAACDLHSEWEPSNG